MTFNIIEKESEIFLRITDQGSGIVPHDVKRVFDPFFTGENGRVKQESTGMGLYLVKEIVNRLGHVVTIQSTVSEGTTVEFSLRQIPYMKGDRIVRVLNDYVINFDGSLPLYSLYLR
ncbi:ATP-binding protein [Peribacillus frigoritolerans]|uniref:ATP-binding protein n=1 Tax=Peribacillus frigoritolerans TaxID=450367 RepID=UPI003ECEA576